MLKLPDVSCIILIASDRYTVGIENAGLPVIEPNYLPWVTKNCPDCPKTDFTIVNLLSFKNQKVLILYRLAGVNEIPV